MKKKYVIQLAIYLGILALALCFNNREEGFSILFISMAIIMFAYHFNSISNDYDLAAYLKKNHPKLMKRFRSLHGSVSYSIVGHKVVKEINDPKLNEKINEFKTAIILRNIAIVLSFGTIIAYIFVVFG
jgi:hypothetical protein